MMKEMEGVEVGLEPLKSDIKTEVREVRGIPIDLAVKRFEPGAKKFEASGKSPEKAHNLPTADIFIYIPGFGVSLEQKAVQEIAQGFASEMEMPCEAIIPSSKTPTTFENFAEAIFERLKENGYKRVYLGGQSQGGSMALYLGTMVEDLAKQDPSYELVGLGLYDSMGLYEQNPLQVINAIMLDSIPMTPIEVASLAGKSIARDVRGNRWSSIVRWMPKAFKRAGLGHNMGMLNEVTAGARKEVLKGKYFWNNLKEIAAKNPHLADIQAPIVLMQGSKDPISSPGKTAPILARGEKNIETVKGERVDHQRSRMIFKTEESTPHLMSEVFKKAHDVTYLVLDKLGRHNVALMRPESVARGTRGAFERMARGQNKQPTAELSTTA